MTAGTAAGGSTPTGGATPSGMGGQINQGGSDTGLAGASGGGVAGSGGNTPSGGTEPAAGGGQTGMAGGGGADAGGAAGDVGGGAAGIGGAAAGETGSGGSAGETPSTGCGAPAPESGRFSIDVGGEMREYILALPDNYDANKPYRLVFGWHPLGGSAQQVASGGYYGLQSQANGEAIFVAGEGLPFQGSSLGWANSNGGDIAFLEAMLDRFRTELCFDENRIFSTGFSFGGMMSYAVACSGLARAVAPMAGNIQVSGCADGSEPVAMMAFHGTEDSVVAIDGGRAGRDVMVERNSCTEQTTPMDPSWCDGVGDSNQPCSCVSYDGCQAGYPVIWCEFNGPHTPAPNSAATIWDFFSQF